MKGNYFINRGRTSLIAAISLTCLLCSFAIPSEAFPLVVKFDATVHFGSKSKKDLRIPQDVKKLHVAELNIKKHFLILSWDLSDPKDMVDEYAIYGLNDAYLSNPPRGYLLKVTRKNTIKFQISNSLDMTPAKALIGYISYDTQSQETFWVVAHNSAGWGMNDKFTLNPNQNPSDYAEIINAQAARTKEPFELLVTFP